MLITYTAQMMSVLDHKSDADGELALYQCLFRVEVSAVRSTSQPRGSPLRSCYLRSHSLEHGLEYDLCHRIQSASKPA